MSTLLKQKLLMAFTTWCINFKKLVKLACSEIMRLFNAWKHSFWNRHPFTTWCIGMLVPVPSDWYWLKTFFTLPRKAQEVLWCKKPWWHKAEAVPLLTEDFLSASTWRVKRFCGARSLGDTKLWQGSPAPIIVALLTSYLTRAPLESYHRPLIFKPSY